MTRSFNVDYVVEHASLSEKISLLAGKDFWHTQDLPRFNVPSIRLSDGPNGVRGTKFFNGVPAACLPCGTGLAATWDPALLYKAGILIGQEAIAKGAHCWLGPTVNIQRSPLGGRGFESFSEDPYLSGKLASTYINGTQSTGVIATIKHFVANDQEHERNSANVVVSQRALREIYLLPFQIALKDSSPGAIMTAYNKVNGTHVSESKEFLRNILQNDWGAKDILVMSDWYGTYSVTESLEAGLDLEMPGPARWRTTTTSQSVSARKLREATIDERARSMLKFVKRASQIPVSAVEGERDHPEDRLLNRRLAADSIVLLKNDSSILPVSPDVKQIALIGPSMKIANYCGGGSASLDAYYTVSPFEGITRALSRDTRVHYGVGCYAHGLLPTLGADIKRPDGQTGVVMKFYNLPHSVRDREVMDQVDVRDTFFQLMDYKNPRLDALFWATLEGTYTAPASGVFQFATTVYGSGNLYIDDVLVVDNTEVQRPGTSFFGKGTAEEVGEVEMLQGQQYNVRLEFASSPTSKVVNPRMVAFPGGAGRIGAALKIDEERSIARAAQLARENKATILCVGLSKDWEAEGFDRPNMDLPGNTVQLITEVLKANPNTVIITQSGTPINMMPWSSQSTTQVHMWYGGNETGNGLADVLFGKVNPSGRLPLSFPLRVEDNPAFLNSKSEAGRIIYGEDIYVGYRYYERVKRDVLFPFGHGLSYTSFAYSKLSISGDKVSVDVSNTGSRAGAETVQLYIGAKNVKSELTIGRPEKELHGFAKVFLEPGETKTAQISLDRFAGAFWDELSDQWTIEAGLYDVFIGRSSQDIVMQGVWEVQKRRTWTGL